MPPARKTPRRVLTVLPRRLEEVWRSYAYTGNKAAQRAAALGRSATVGFSGRNERRGLHLSLLRYLQRVVDLDAEVSDSTLQFAVPEEKLDRSQIPGSPVYQRRLGAAH